MTPEKATQLIAINAENISVKLGKSAKKRAVLHGLNLDVPAAQWTSIVGPNGAGKSTLLKALAGGVPYAGRVTLLGQCLQQWPRRLRAQKLAWLGQNEAVPEAMTVWAVVMLGRLPHQAWMAAPSPADHAAVELALHAMHLWAWRDRTLGELSGGECQRVLLARVLVVQAAVVLMDEPLASLDPPHQAHFLTLVQALAAQGTTVVTVLHEISMALHADNMVVMAQGQMVHQGPCSAAPTHQALCRVFDDRLAIAQVQGQWVALPQ